MMYKLKTISHSIFFLSAFLSSVLLLTAPLGSYSQGAIVNEFSNGLSGSKEYIELVVIGATGNENCGPVDLRGFYVDDNNGDFSGGPSSGEGIAGGHVRFSMTGPWGAIPTGSIILIYNSADKNPAITLPDDPFDANSDSVYIIPDNHPDLEGCSSNPNTTNANYIPCTYGAALWTRIGLRNSGDAAQTRDASSNFFHGLSYGSPLNGGPLGIHFPGSGGGQVYMLTNNSDFAYIDPSNFSKLAASGNETPGVANTINNQAWIDFLRHCPLPVQFEMPFQGKITLQNTVELSWTTSIEKNNKEFIVERSNQILMGFEELAVLPGHGNSLSPHSYQAVDHFPLNGTVFYRLKQIDMDGSVMHSPVVAVNFEAESLTLETFYPNPASSRLNLILNAKDDFKFTLFDLRGKEVFQKEFDNPNGIAEFNVDLSKLNEGWYLWRINNRREVLNGKIAIAR